MCWKASDCNTWVNPLGRVNTPGCTAGRTSYGSRRSVAGDKGIVLWICHKEAQMSMVSTTKVRMDRNGIGFQCKFAMTRTCWDSLGFKLDLAWESSFHCN